MNTADLVSRVRSLLDEREAGFWSDKEIIDSLNDAGDEVYNFALFIFTERGAGGGLPLLLTPFVKEERYTSVTGSEVPLPGDLSYILEVKCSPTAGGTEVPCSLWSGSMLRYAREHNSLLRSGANNLYCHVSGGDLVFSVPLVGGSYTISYLGRPVRMTETVEPELPGNAAGALVAYAVALLLEKDRQGEEAASFFRLYTSKIEQLAQL